MDGGSRGSSESNGSSALVYFSRIWGDFEREETTLTHQLCPKLPNLVIHLVCVSPAKIRVSDVLWNITVCVCIPKLHVLVCNWRPFPSWIVFKCTLIYMGVQSSTYHLLSIRKGFCCSDSLEHASVLQEVGPMTPVSPGQMMHPVAPCAACQSKKDTASPGSIKPKWGRWSFFDESVTVLKLIALRPMLGLTDRSGGWRWWFQEI